MTIVLYNPNSRGGNFDYALRLAEGYKKNSAVKKFILVLPGNANIPSSEEAQKILLNDQPAFRNRIYSRFYFLWRTFINPLIFFFFIRKIRGYIIFNDFDQVSSFLWVPFYKLLKRKVVFSVFLHDPDRDKYFSSPKISALTMRTVMSLMDIAFYHEILPDKPYYKNQKTIYVSVPHGLYDNQGSGGFNDELFRLLLQFKGNSRLLGALGNIRHEKNYTLIIRNLKAVPGIKLFIAGIPANTTIDINELEVLVRTEQLSDRVLILQKYLDDQEFKTVAKVCDGFILYYANTFKSQSGILNLLAPFRKTLLVSSNDSPLSMLVRQYNLGLMANADSEKDLIIMLRAFAENEVQPADWEGYFAYASWQNHVNIAIQALKKIRE